MQKKVVKMSNFWDDPPTPSCENSQLFFSSNENLPNSYHQILVLLVSMNGLTAVNMHKNDFDEINFETKVQSFVYMSMNIS